MMKKVLLIIGFCVAVNAIQAQSNKVVSAWKYLGDYNKNKDLQSLQKAKESIDLASANESTKGEAKTWMYRAQIYQASFEYNLRVNTDKHADVTDANKKTLLGYQSTGTEDLDKTYEACKKVIELDAKNTYAPEAKQRMALISRYYENKGLAGYTAKLYPDALAAYEKAIEISTALGKVDSANTANAALIAGKGTNYAKSKTYYQQLIDWKYGKAETYNEYVKLCLLSGDTVTAKEANKKGLELYPGDYNLVISETNFALQAGESQRAIDYLTVAIAKTPNDANLYLVLGNLYDNIANPKDAAGKELDKPANFDELITKAEANYKKAIELKPDYYDALYNLAVLYNNLGVMKAKKADTIIDQSKYAKANAEANAEYEKAIPVFEKALEIDPTDKSSMFALKQLYARTNQQEKLKAMTERLKAN